MNDKTLNDNSNDKKKSSHPILKLFIFLIFSFALYIVFKGPYKDKFFPKIVAVPNINFSTNQNEKFDLPSAVNVKLSNGKLKEVPITWSGTLDTALTGEKNLVGTVPNYNDTVNLKANILPHKIITKISSTAVENSLVQINIPVPTNINRVLIQVKKGEYIDKTVSNVSNGGINTKISLRDGFGKYYITLYTTNTTEGASYYNYYNEFEVTNKDKRNNSFILPNDYIQSDWDEIILLANNIIVGCKTNLEKTKAIYDWVTSNIAYDVDAYFSNNIKDYTSLETLKEKTALCNGYANLTAALNRSLGIKTKVVSGTLTLSDGTSIRHAWNETLIDDKWISQDTTLGSGGIDATTGKFIKQYSNNFFNPSKEDFRTTHIKESES